MFTSAGTAVIAHRGASAYAPEHTVDAYDLAISMGADTLELDVRLSADGVPVIVHDTNLWRTAGDPRSVDGMELAELRDVPGPGRPLTLREVLERYGSEVRYLIDLKAPRAPMERRIAEVVAAAGLGASTQVQSFSRGGINRVRRSDPSLSVALLYAPHAPREAILGDLPRAGALVDTIGPHFPQVDRTLVRAAHLAGLRVQPYTVNDPAEVARLLDLGVDGVITDRPDVVTARLAEPGVALAA